MVFPRKWPLSWDLKGDGLVETGGPVEWHMAGEHSGAWTAPLTGVTVANSTFKKLDPQKQQTAWKELVYGTGEKNLRSQEECQGIKVIVRNREEVWQQPGKLDQSRGMFNTDIFLGRGLSVFSYYQLLAPTCLLNVSWFFRKLSLCLH